MILYDGTLYETQSQDKLISELPSRLTDTLASNRLDIETVINAFDALCQKLANGELDHIINQIDYEEKDALIDQAIHMMSRDYLEYKVSVELGCNGIYQDLGHSRLSAQRYPLGVIFHIAAGNMDMLPIVSIAEGLLAGNINILKLPRVDQGLTIEVLKYLVDFEPKLREYIYVFDTPSSDVAAMKKLADLSDGIAVWGGDEAITAVRSLAKPGTRLIEWGHKLGFCYISGDYTNFTNDLRALADHIITTRQLLCSSCQVIYLDTTDSSTLVEFARYFLPMMEIAYARHPILDVGAIAELSLRRYTDSLLNIVDSSDVDSTTNIIKGDHTSITVARDMEDNALELSYMYGNVIVKALPQDKIISTLRGSKEYLQTAGLICDDANRDAIANKLFRSGIERVTPAGNMSMYYDGEAHDGEYPLLRYTRIINYI